MATPNAATKPEYVQDVSEEELSYLTPDPVPGPDPPTDPNIADFAARMLRHGEEYAKWQAQEVTAAPDAEVQTLDAFQQDRAMTQQGREERLAINAIRQEQQRLGAEREEASSLQAMNQTPAANDNQQRTPDEPAQGEASRPTAALSRDPLSSQEARQGSEEIVRDGREELFAPSAEVAQENSPKASIQRDGREELFRPDGPEPDGQEQTQEQEQAREQQMEIDR